MPIGASAGTLDIENATLRSNAIAVLTNLVAGNDQVRQSGPPALEVYGDPSHGGNEARVELVSNITDTVSNSFTRLTSNAGVFSIETGTSGTSDNGTITFGGFQNERLRITSDGKVGVGTTDPGRPLEIAAGGGGAILNIKRTDAGSGQGAIGFVNMNSNVCASITSARSGAEGGQLIFFTAPNDTTQTSDNPYLINERMRITADGNVGIGTTSPGAKFTLYGDDTQDEGGLLMKVVDRVAFDNGFTGIGLGGYATTSEPIIQVAKSAIIHERTGFNGTGNLMFCNDDTTDNNDVSNTHARMTITGDGNVGVGTTSPNMKLQVEGSSVSTQELVKFATYDIRHHRADSSFENLINYNSVDGTTMYNNRDNFFYVQIPAFGGETLYTHSIAAYDSTYFQAILRDPDGAKPVLGTNTIYTVHVYSKRTDINGNMTTAGRVGIGKTDPDASLEVFNNTLGSTPGNSTDILKFGGDSNGAGALLLTAERLSSGSNWTSAGLRLQKIVDVTKMAYVQFGSNTGDNNGELLFGTGDATERMRITGGGNVGIGTNNPQGKLHVYPGSNGAFMVGSLSTTEATAPMCIRDAANQQIHFYYSTNKVGSITSTPSATAYNTTSDYRLKENLVELTSALDRVNEISVYRFNFIAEPNKTVDGFLAHELQSIIPEAVTGVKDEMIEFGVVTRTNDGTIIHKDVKEPKILDEGTEWSATSSRPIYQGVDQSKIVPLLTRSVQELSIKNDTLEIQLASVLARLDALENA
jgi:hypothetical protein